ncbi:MAG: GNAT family N-acetyltransferase [Candidatus Hodarchaeota archaeon]
MSIRIVKQEDIETLVKLEIPFRNDRLGNEKEEWRVFDSCRTREAYNELLSDDDTHILVGEVSGKVVSFFIARVEKVITNGREFSQGTICDVFVSEQHRGKGLAAGMYQESLKWFKERGCSYLQLCVYENNPAAEMYKKWGFDDYIRCMKKKLE